MSILPLRLSFSRPFSEVFRICVAGLLCAVLSCCVVLGQSTFGTVLGTVKEPSGAIVFNAKVALVNTGTNATRSTITDESGNFQFTNVEVGMYLLTVEAVGFQKVQFTAFDLAARATKR